MGAGGRCDVDHWVPAARALASGEEQLVPTSSRLILRLSRLKVAVPAANLIVVAERRERLSLAPRRAAAHPLSPANTRMRRRKRPPPNAAKRMQTSKQTHITKKLNGSCTLRMDTTHGSVMQRIQAPLARARPWRECGAIRAPAAPLSAPPVPPTGRTPQTGGCILVLVHRPWPTALAVAG